MNKTNLILFTIGPVQRYIETARKTEDLWMGSYILSYLNSIAMEELRTELGEEKNIEILFPANEVLTDLLPKIPNRFLAQIDGEPEKLKSALKNVETEVQNEFKKIAEFVFDKAFDDKWEGTFAEELLNRQIDNFLEIYWVIHPFAEDETYKDAYKEIERKLGAVKNCRWFNPVEEESLKCSLCGEREVVHFNEFTSEPMGKMKRTIAKEWESKWNETKVTPRVKFVRNNEYLCSVCLAKRMGELYFNEKLGIEGKGMFPSTAEVATASFKYKMTKGNGNAGHLVNYYEFVKSVSKFIQNSAPKVIPLPRIEKDSLFDANQNIDGYWLYEENWREEHIAKNVFNKKKEELSEYQKNKIAEILNFSYF